jgi:hypothetical protein
LIFFISHKANADSQTYQLTTMKYLILLFGILLTSCGNNKGASKADSMMMDVNVSSFFSQDSFPGVESNLRNTRVYKCDFTVSTKVPFQIVELMVDSIKLPVPSLTLNGEILKNDHVQISGDSAHVVFQANRMFFNAEARNQIFNVETYALSGVTLPDLSGKMVILVEGQLQTVDLGNYVKKASVFHP